MNYDFPTPGSSFRGMRVVVMGLGLNGGGLESARYLASEGASVTVTDLRDEKVLEPSIAELQGLPIRYVLGRHEISDFREADFAVKNPAVKPDSPYLAAARRVETDLSLFLSRCPAPLIAVTGSKGKSSVSSALHWTLASAGRKAFLGGNITLSPLSFLHGLKPEDAVVLELSSWQLGDLRGRRRENGHALLKPRVAIITAIMPDHLDRYASMEAYVSDKRVIYEGQDRADVTVCGEDFWGESFAAESGARVLRYRSADPGDRSAGGWIAADGSGVGRLTGEEEARVLVPPALRVPGRHQKGNLLAAGLGLLDFGLESEEIRKGLETFPGIEHRLEFFHRSRSGVRFYNDSAATIPEASAAAVRSFDSPPVLVAGGTDKALDFAPLAAAAPGAKAIVLLAGSGSDLLMPLLQGAGIAYEGPYSSLEEAALRSIALAGEGDSVVLSPGCTSFGMFLNEFDRGRKWKDAIVRLAP